MLGKGFDIQNKTDENDSYRAGDFPWTKFYFPDVEIQGFEEMGYYWSVDTGYLELFEEVMYGYASAREFYYREYFQVACIIHLFCGDLFYWHKW
jgi:hypothetical protein